MPSTRVDPQGMFEAVSAFGEHFHEGWITAGDLAIPLRAADLDHVVVLGMGGSAIGADLLRAFALPESKLPVTVVRDYTIPAWVGPKSLVIASSYSGDTEETLSALDEAIERDTHLCAVTSGGQLLARARAMGMPHVVLPGGYPPRAALGYSFAALLRLAHKVGLVSIDDQDFYGTTEALRHNAGVLADEEGRAAEMAEALAGRIAVLYAGSPLMEAVARRWCTQIQENAKQPAFVQSLPEANHNEILAWEGAPEDLRRRLAAIALRDAADHPRVMLRLDLTRQIVAPRAAAWMEHRAAGESRLERMLTALQLGDFVSVFLAFAMGVDPTPVDTIERLKQRLAQA